MSPSNNSRCVKIDLLFSDPLTMKWVFLRVWMPCRTTRIWCNYRPYKINKTMSRILKIKLRQANQSMLLSIRYSLIILEISDRWFSTQIRHFSEGSILVSCKVNNKTNFTDPQAFSKRNSQTSRLNSQMSTSRTLFNPTNSPQTNPST